MSDNPHDDIWARIRAESGTEPQARDGVDVIMAPADRAGGSLQRTAANTVPSSKIAWETTEEAFDGPPKPRRRKRAQQTGAPKLLIGATIVALLWVGAVGTLLLANAEKYGVDNASFLPNLLMLLLGPALALLAGFMGESIAKSNREARILINAARKMLEPEQSGETAVRSTALAVRSEIGRLEGAISNVAERLATIESNVSSQTSALSAAGTDAQGGADRLVASMEGERQRLDNLL
jgi:hypothetical protein